MNAVVRKVPHQLRLHGEMRHDARGLNAFNLQAHPLVEENFVFVDLAQTFDELRFKVDLRRGVCARRSHGAI